ncbi:MAG: cytochrome c [Woeseiaceae bacterium]
MSIYIQSVVTPTLLISMSMASHASASTQGEDLYAIKCACCHGDENTISLGASKIKKALTNNSIRAHYFKLSDSDTTLITNYLSKDKD